MIEIIKMPYGIKKYTKLEKLNNFRSKYGCEACGFEGKLYRHGFYYRNLITFKNAFRVVILRCKCQSCGKTYSLIPSFIIPYRQYAYYVILTTLIFMFNLKYSYSKILKIIKSLNSLSFFSSTELSIWKSRFIDSCPSIRLFAAQFKDSYFDMPTVSPSEALNKIIVFSRLRRDFNLEYFLLMPKYFLCKT